MKTKIFIALGSLAALPLISAPPMVTVQVPAPPPVVVVPAPAPVVTVQTPAPAVTVEATVPDTYIWDGSEYVGVVGTQYYYLGPDNVWLAFDADRLARFHEWERIHSDWRDHAIRNELYRHDAHGHDVPFHDDHRDMNHDHDHGH